MALTQITSAGISDDAVTTDKLANAINTARDANTAKTTNATHSGEVTGATALTIADNVVDEANLKVSNSPTNGYFLSAQSGNTGGLTWAQVSTDLVADTSPQLGGDLDSNGNNIKITDGEELRFGDGNDLVIKHDGSHSYINDNGTGNLYLSVGGAFYIQNQAQDEALAIFNENGSCDLYYDNSKKFETTAGGATVHCTDASDGFIVQGDLRFRKESGTTTYIKWDGSDEQLEVFDDVKVSFGDGHDLQIYHDGTNSYIDETNGSNNLWIRGQANIYMGFGSEKMATFSPNGAVELYYNDVKQLETTENGISLPKGVIRGNTGSKVILGGTIDPSSDKTWNFSFSTNAHGYNQGYVFNVKFYLNHWNSGNYFKYIEVLRGGRGNVTGLDGADHINNLGASGSAWNTGHLDYEVDLSNGTMDGSNVSLFKVKYDAESTPGWTSGYYLEVVHSGQIGTVSIT